jgi:hypothetical protein
MLVHGDKAVLQGMLLLVVTLLAVVAVEVALLEEMPQLLVMRALAVERGMESRGRTYSWTSRSECSTSGSNSATYAGVFVPL